jgi:nucleoside-diphosphate kinase
MQKTLAIIKPDAVRRNIIGEIIRRIEMNNFKINKMKMLQLTEDDAKQFYYVHKDKPFYGELVEFMVSDKVVVMLLESENAITKWRNLMGATDPSEALPGTIRAELAISKQENSVHGSDAEETAKFEIDFFFKA